MSSKSICYSKHGRATVDGQYANTGCLLLMVKIYVQIYSYLLNKMTSEQHITCTHKDPSYRKYETSVCDNLKVVTGVYHDLETKSRSKISTISFLFYYLCQMFMLLYVFT